MKSQDKAREDSGGISKADLLGRKKEVKSVTISPDVVDPDDIEMLQDLIVAAFNEALKKMEEENAGNMNKLAGGLGSMGIGGLF